MKKILFLSSLAMGILLPSCNTGDGETTSTGSFASYNLITNLDNGDIQVSKNTYNFEINWTKALGEISSESLIINNSNWQFTTEPSTLYYYGSMFMILPQGYVMGNYSLPLNDASFLISPVCNYGYPGIYFNTTPVPGYANLPSNSQYMITTYKIGNQYQVSTFITDAFFYGDSTIIKEGENSSPATRKDICYRIVMDVPNKKADLLIYKEETDVNDQTTTTGVGVVQGLDIEYKDAGYLITGSDIVMKEITEVKEDLVSKLILAENPDYVFNNIRIKSTSVNLASCNISFEIEGKYKFNFNGSYFFEPKMPNE